MFILIVDDFGVEYLGKQHADHLASVLRKYHEITIDWEGEKYAGIDLKWNYLNLTFLLSIEGYIREVLAKYGQPMPTKRKLSPHKHCDILYCAKQQFTPDEDTSPNLNLEGIQRVQCIVGDLLYYAHMVDNKLLMALSAIFTQKSAATKCTAAVIHQLLYCVATYPNDGNIYCSSDMILCAHFNGAYLNESKSHSRSGSLIFLSEDDPIP